ncbi:MAG: hypothetical protein IT563_06470 [Alphaproteobacteria bacterium]|nr:hypothetical protein [Alphaproteobacteria bacterium]
MSERQGSVEPLRGLLAPIRAGLNTAAMGDILVGDVDGALGVPAPAAGGRVLDDLNKGLESAAAFNKYGAM